MKLYIANLSAQNHEFLYRKPEDSRVRLEQIPAGEQRLICDDQPEVVRAIIEQHERYGLVSAADMIENRGVALLAYQLGKPLPLDAMLTAHERNQKYLEEDAAERRKEAAMAAAVGVEDAARMAGLPSPRRFSVGVKEVPKDPRDASTLDETIHVAVGGNEPGNGPIDWAENGSGNA